MRCGIALVGDEACKIQSSASYWLWNFMSITATEDNYNRCVQRQMPECATDVEYESRSVEDLRLLLAELIQGTLDGREESITKLFGMLRRAWLPHVKRDFGRLGDEAEEPFDRALTEALKKKQLSKVKNPLSLMPWAQRGKVWKTWLGKFVWHRVINIVRKASREEKKMREYEKSRTSGMHADPNIETGMTNMTPIASEIHSAEHIAAQVKMDSEILTELFRKEQGRFGAAFQGTATFMLHVFDEEGNFPTVEEIEKVLGIAHATAQYHRKKILDWWRQVAKKNWLSI